MLKKPEPLSSKREDFKTRKINFKVKGRFTEQQTTTTLRENREPKSQPSNMGLNRMAVTHTDEFPSTEWIREMVARFSSAACGLLCGCIGGVRFSFS